MPEGDIVWFTARRLHETLAGRELLRAELRVPRHADARLAGRTVIEVVSRGKHLLTRLAPSESSGATTLHTHLGMDGSWRLRPPDAAWPPRRSSVRAVLATDRALAIGDKLARVDLIRTAAESALVGHLGPDLLGDDWDADEAARRLARDPERPIGEALLDQSNLAGIGNLYRAEVLFLRGVRPTTTVADAGDLRALADLARKLLWTNRFGFEQSTTGNSRKGFQHYVYHRNGAPCRRCGTVIRAGVLGQKGQERTIWWCPNCQPGDTPGKDNSR